MASLKFHVEGFRQLRNCTVELRNLTALVGENGAGKTSLLEAMQFYQALVGGQDLNAAQWVAREGGWDQVASDGTATSIRFKLEVEIAAVPHVHILDVIKQGETPVVGYENLLIRGTERIKTDQSGVNEFLIASKHGGRFARGMGPYPLSRLQTGEQGDMAPFVDYVASWRFHHFLPELTGRSVKAAPYRVLDRWGADLAGLVQTIATETPKRLTELTQLMAEVIPDLDDVAARWSRNDNDANVELRLTSTRNRVHVRGDHVASGHMKALAILAALMQRPDPALLALEEPDAGLHPRLMEWLVEFLRLKAQDRIVVISTHNPWLVDHLHVDELRIVERGAEGTTIRAPKDPAEGRKHVEEALGTLAMNGMLK